MLFFCLVWNFTRMHVEELPVKTHYVCYTEHQLLLGETMCVGYLMGEGRGPQPLPAISARSSCVLVLGTQMPLGQRVVGAVPAPTGKGWQGGDGQVDKALRDLDAQEGAVAMHIGKCHFVGSQTLAYNGLQRP